MNPYDAAFIAASEHWDGVVEDMARMDRFELVAFALVGVKILSRGMEVGDQELIGDMRKHMDGLEELS